jgi:F-type H+-transporting ATPase subunit b
MKLATAIAATALLGMLPSLALAAEHSTPEGGSWLVLLFYIINFAIFVYLIAHYAAPAIRDFFHQRATLIRNNLRQSQADYKIAQEAEQQVRTLLAGLETEKARVLQDMRDATEVEVARIREQSRTAAQRIRRDGELMAQNTADQARRQVRAAMAAIAIAKARELIRAEFESRDQSRLLNDFIDTIRHGARS